MAQHTINISSNGTFQIGTIDRNRNYHRWEATMFVDGTFGGGSLAWLWSPDKGVTKLPINDQSSTRAPIISIANDSFLTAGQSGDKNSDKVQLYVTLTGASSPNLTIGFIDNN